MPLDPRCGSRARGRNVATLIHEDRPPRQAVAIAYATQRRAGCPLSTPPGHPVQTHRPLVTFDLYAQGQRVGTVSTSLGYTAAHVEASESAARGYPVTARKRSVPKARNRTNGTLFDLGRRTFPERPGPMREALLGADLVADASKTRGAFTDEPAVVNTFDARDANDAIEAAIAAHYVVVRREGRSLHARAYVALTPRGYQLLAETGQQPHAIEWIEWIEWMAGASPIVRARTPAPKPPKTPATPKVRTPRSGAARAAKVPTFKAIQTAILANLRTAGWNVQASLKVPHATSRSGRLRLWFKPQAVWYSTGHAHGSYSLAHAASLHTDLRSFGAPGNTPEEYAEAFREAIARQFRAEW